jgi:hypothetical protein
VAGPTGFVAALLLPLQQILEGAAAGCRVRAAWPVLLELGAVPIRPAHLDKFTLKQLEPAALLIAFLCKKQVAAVGADLGCAWAAAEADRTILDRNRDGLPAAAASQAPLALIGGQTVAMGVADVIEDHGLAFSW